MQPKSYSVYMLVNNFDLEKRMVYIGITRNWAVRKYQHNRRCNDPVDRGYNWKIYKYIRQTGGMSNWQMVKLDEFTCTDKKYKSKKERFYIEYYHSKLNTHLPVEN